MDEVVSNNYARYCKQDKFTPEHQLSRTIATYAASVMFRMAEDKGGEYTKRLSIDLNNALYQ